MLISTDANAEVSKLGCTSELPEELLKLIPRSPAEQLVQTVGGLEGEMGVRCPDGSSEQPSLGTTESAPLHPANGLATEALPIDLLGQGVKAVVLLMIM